MRQFKSSKIICIVFCAATAIAAPAQILTTLANFAGTNGANPYSALIQGTDGNFYGTTEFGGSAICQPYGCGTVFKMTRQGTLSTLYSFCPQTGCADGSNPTAGLVQAADGNFYGTTAYGGGPNSRGTVFRITSSGTLTTLYSFCLQTDCPDGNNPFGTLVQASSGALFGTTLGGGRNSVGTVFKITPDGQFTTVYSFCSLSACADGEGPYDGLARGSDGNFCGVTMFGGSAYGGGTVFQVTPGGTLTTLHRFCPDSSCSDGQYPVGGLVQGNDGRLYGTTSRGGTYGAGTVYAITTEGTLTTLHNFTRADGYLSMAALVLDTDGSFYGTTSEGGTADEGTIFKITPSGAFSTIYNFCSQDGCTDGFDAYSALLQGADGKLYGTTTYGGTNNDGTVFSLALASPSPLQFVVLTPCRLVDTRPQHSGGGPIPGGTFQAFNLPQLALTQGCADLSSAAAYSLNVTVVPSEYLGYLTLWPTGEAQPGVSTLNSLDGRIKANAAIVPAGDQGAVSVYVTNTTNVVIDIDGYFAPVTSSTLAFYPVTPCRIADTRAATDFLPGLGTPHLSGGVPRDFPIMKSSCVPSGVSPQAYSLNLAVVPYPTLGFTLGYLGVWPTGQQPAHPVSTLNNLTGTIVANATIVPAGTGGDITLCPSSDTDLVIDINGYFAPAGPGGLSLYAVTPCRVIDTRKVGSRQPFSGLMHTPVDVVDSMCGPPSTAQAYVFNATVVPTGALGYLTLWRNDPAHQPMVSTLNSLDGWITNNMAVVPTTDGKIDAFASDLTQLILDISSYFAP